MNFILLFVVLCCSISNVTSFAPSFGRRMQSFTTRLFGEVNMPALSSTMTEGTIVSWNKKIGDKVTAGDVLLVVASDKVDICTLHSQQ